jgi:hypothetical protein
MDINWYATRSAGSKGSLRIVPTEEYLSRLLLVLRVEDSLNVMLNMLPVREKSRELLLEVVRLLKNAMVFGSLRRESDMYSMPARNMSSILVLRCQLRYST